MKSSLFATLAACLLLAPLAGCQSDGPDGGVDARYLRVPDSPNAHTPAVKEPINLLFPTAPTRQWEVAVTAIDKQMRESVRVGAARIGHAASGVTTLVMYQNGKQTRDEVYQVTPDLLALVAAGGTENMTMSPPMPLLRAKSLAGAQYRWEGNITFKGAVAPATAYSRVLAPSEITTPAGKFNAYRVDTALTTIIEGNSVTFPASRWFAPGVGIVRQMFWVGNARVEKELVSYKGG